VIRTAISDSARGGMSRATHEGMLPFALFLFVIVGAAAIVIDLRRDARRWRGGGPSHTVRHSAEREHDRCRG
jgi:hypothetical protein